MTIEEALTAILAELRELNAHLRQHFGGSSSFASRPGTSRNPEQVATDTLAGRVWDISDAARHLHISSKTLRRLIAKGNVRTVRLGARRLVISDLEMQRILNEGTG